MTDIHELPPVARRELEAALNILARGIFAANSHVGWWDDSEWGSKKTGANAFVPDKYLVPTKLALAHSELSEALEGFRKGLADDHLPHRPMCEVELADTIIRILDLAGYLGYDIGGAVMEKLAYNATRADHKREARNAPGGKAV